jgi:peptidoglycan/LPS O-acetylase OafA/YrhL
LVTTARPLSGIGRMLEVAPLRWIGRLSYSLYLWQQPFVSQYHHGVLQRFPLNLLLALICAFASYYCVEKPMVRLGQRLTRRDEPEQAEALGEPQQKLAAAAA